MLDSLEPDTSIQSATDYSLIARAIAYLGGSWQQQPDLDELARHLDLSAGHTQRLFKRWCGLSPKEFVQAITIEHARAMLADLASLLDTALEVGLSGTARLHDLFITHEAMTPGDYKRRGEGLTVSWGFHASPFGLALVMVTERGICGIGFADSDDAAGRRAALDDMIRRWPAASYVESVATTMAAARNIFTPAAAGSREPLRLVMIGSGFDRAVWGALTRIPTGRATTYAGIAALIGKPTAARAVGAAVGRNPLAFVVPCHRVLGKAGTMTGYHWGITRKQAIIGWEKGRL